MVLPFDIFIRKMDFWNFSPEYLQKFFFLSSIAHCESTYHSVSMPPISKKNSSININISCTVVSMLFRLRQLNLFFFKINQNMHIRYDLQRYIDLNMIEILESFYCIRIIYIYICINKFNWIMRKHFLQASPTIKIYKMETTCLIEFSCSLSQWLQFLLNTNYHHYKWLHTYLIVK